jgi:hypothetical protein
MIARHPVWLVLPGEPGPGRHRLQAEPDREVGDPAYDPDEGLLRVALTEDTELLATDSDERFKGGDMPPLSCIVPRDAAHPHYQECGWERCGHTVEELPGRYERTDAGWYLVVTLPAEAGEVWIHEDDVPVDNDPTRPGWAFGRRPTADVEARS